MFQVPHEELILSLAETLSGSNVVIPNVHLGASWTLSGGGRGIVDLLAFKFKYKKPDITIYEIKSSRADLRGDLKREKYRKYMPHCHRLVFAVPLGMKVDDIPDDCGICTYNPEKKTWHFKRRGKVNPEPQFDLETLLAVLYAMDKRDVVLKQHQIASSLLDGKIMQWLDIKKAFGKKVADIISEHRYMENDLRLVKGSNQMLREAKDRIQSMLSSPYIAQIGNSYQPYAVHKDVFDALKTLPGAEIKKWNPCEVIVREICQPPVDKPADEE